MTTSPGTPARVPVGAARARPRRRIPGPAILAALGLFLVLGAWIVSCPPDSAPDEASHLTRGIAAADGDLRGADDAAAYRGRGLLQYAARTFVVPRSLAVADDEPCYHRRPTVPAACGPHLLATHATTAASHVGGYFPLPYLPLGAAEDATSTPDHAVYAGRVVSAALCGALLLLAFVCLRSRWQRVAWLVALTPVTLWTAATAATNGLEVAGGVCVCASAAALAQKRLVLGTTAWVAGAVALGTAKAAGPAWLAAVLVLMAVATRGQGAVPRLRGRWWAVLAIPVLAVAGNLVWSALYLTNPGVSFRERSPGASAHAATTQVVHGAVPQMFTRFGWLDTEIPQHLWLLGAAAVALVVVAGVVTGSGWQRAATGLAVVTFAAATLAFTYVEVRGGYTLQARYTAVLFVVVPIVSVVGSRRRRAEPPLVVSSVAVALWMAATALAVFYDLRRYVVGSHGPLSLAHPAWLPPGGLTVALAMLVLGVVVLASAALLTPARRTARA